MSAANGESAVVSPLPSGSKVTKQSWIISWPLSTAKSLLPKSWVTPPPLPPKRNISAESQTKNPYSFASSDAQPSFGKGVGLLMAIIGAVWVSAIFSAHSLRLLRTTGGEIRTLLQSCLYTESFIISPEARKPAQSRNYKPSGKNLNIEEAPAEAEENLAWTQSDMLVLMNTDTQRIELAVADFNKIWSGFSVVPIALGLLWWFGSYPAFCIGLAILVATPFVLLLMKPILNARRRLNLQADIRVNVVGDIVNGIRLLKTFGWEEIYLKKLLPVRKQELWENKLIFFFVSVVSMYSALISRGCNLAAVSVYAITRNVEETQNVVPLLAIFSQMSRVMANFPQGLVSLFNAGAVTLKDDATGKEDLIERPGVTMRDAHFSWTQARKERTDSTQNSEKVILELQQVTLVSEENHCVQEFMNPLTLSVGTSELIAIVGPVSCGKSSVLAGIVGDMELIGGEMTVSSKPAYCPQAPWIQNASVRENITFGNVFSQELYSDVLDACCLQTDLDTFPSGDQTILGEKGITLSGGQKQRVHLARTLYHNKDIVILDDPLSAVDVHTGETIFRKAVKGMCAGKCRILATHQLQILGQCDRVLFMENGAIVASGTFDDLLANNERFIDFVGICKQKDAVHESEMLLQNSVLSPENSKDIQKVPDFMQKEERALNHVSWKAYMICIKLAGSLWFVIFEFVICALSQVANVSVGLAIAWWSGKIFKLSTESYIGITLGFIFGHIVLWIYFYTAIHARFVRSSGVISQKALVRVMRAPISFFDSTPIGRILNRFTVDINLTDSVLPATVWLNSLSIMAILSIIGLTISYVPLAAVIILPWALIGLALVQYYKSAPLEIKRLEATRSSFVVSKFTEGLSGKSCIKSADRVDEFAAQLNDRIDELNSIHLQAFSCAAWVEIRQNMVSNLLFFAIGLLLLTKRHSVTPGVIVVVLFNSADLLGYLTNILEASADLQRGMNAVERLTYYANELSQEPASHLDGFNTDKSWPTKGSITFDAAVMRYRPELDPSINKLTMHIAGGEKVGIVGRTGAGKSSILAILLRMVELSEGSISIDGVDISTIGLHDLRSRIAVIPQDPTLFLGTIRSNLDPEDRMDDLRLNKALFDAALGGGDVTIMKGDRIADEKDQYENGKNDADNDEKAADGSSNSISNVNSNANANSDSNSNARGLTLDSPVLSGGSNLSHGERQLMALARALARDSKIIISDEATSSVDLTTDTRIQQTLQYGLHDKTVLTIAHRLNTVMHYDKICVLDKGRVLEYDTPLALFQRQEGIFRKMCDASMITEEMIKGEK